MRDHLSKRASIAILIYMMVQAVTFGVGVILVMATPLANFAMTLMPYVVATSLIASAPLAWFIAPLARARHERLLNARDPSRGHDQPPRGHHYTG
ncbi:hypothetical protein M2323_000515 [Rhodoblastus acidophilus]|uniref:hypothetical protein n=1 Tax=Rhodoblastus acidophilus TaxID=1074 RepID=UPI00183ADD4A|nr:hypothetical protein [Rhodoblastus acidophilus]MCW2282750.1 hypothetical protein [Rhodoblastus acidophilus]MCW2331611.1 hypothetical protein [Rhodoblastus acidophilus]